MTRGKRKKIYESLVARDGSVCVACGAFLVRGSKNGIGVRPTIDHKIPQSRGGSDELDNLQLMCRTCNGIKGSSAISVNDLICLRRKYSIKNSKGKQAYALPSSYIPSMYILP